LTVVLQRGRWIVLRVDQQPPRQGHYWLFHVQLRTAKGLFVQTDLNLDQAIPVFNDFPELQTHGNWPRIRVRGRNEEFGVLDLYLWSRAENAADPRDWRPIG